MRVRQKETLCRPGIAQLVMRGATRSGLDPGAAVLAELARDIASDAIGVFVGFRNDVPKGVVVAQLPSSAFHRAPMIGLAYSVQDHGISRAVAERLRGWLVASGFHEAITLNRQHTDRSFIRGLGYFGAGEREGSLIGFHF